MEDNKNTPQTIDEYILQCSPEVQEKLQSVRKVIREAAPDASEKMSWRMPTFYLYGNLVHFAAFKNHIGLYPGESGIENFQTRFAEYKWSKGAVQFPMNKPLPFDLIRDIVTFRAEKNRKDAQTKANSKKKQRFHSENGL